MNWNYSLKRKNIDEERIAAILGISTTELYVRRVLRKREDHKYWAKSAALIGFLMVIYSIIVAFLFKGTTDPSVTSFVVFLFFIGIHIVFWSGYIFMEFERLGSRVSIS